MKALVYHGPREVSVDNVDDAKIERPTDVVVKITATNNCGSDLHMYEGRTDFEEGPDAYERFDKREDGWTKVVLHPDQAA